MSAKAEAWLLDAGALRVAVAPSELVEVLYRPRIYSVPLARPGFTGFVQRRHAIVPVLDLDVLAGRIAGGPATDPFIAILRFPLGENGGVGLGSLLLREPPVMIDVDDAAACPLPAPAVRWRGVARSCFLHAGEAVPILRLEALFV